jgi:hypothetical protein
MRNDLRAPFLFDSPESGLPGDPEMEEASSREIISAQGSGITNGENLVMGG